MAFLNETGLQQVWSKIKTKVSSIEDAIDYINEIKVDKVDGKDLSTNDYTTNEKNKLAGIATGATKVIVDSALSSTSTNAIQNKVVANMKSDIDGTLSTKFDTIATSGDGNIITNINKSGTTINAEKNAFATTVKEGNPVSEIGIAGAGFSAETIFEPKQEGSGDPSPDNIRPISGWTGVTLTRCGKNLLSKAAAGSQTSGGITFTNNGDGSYTIKGTSTGSIGIQFATEVPITIPVGAYLHLGNTGALTNYVAFVLYFTDGINFSSAFNVENRVREISNNYIGKTINAIGIYVNGAQTVDITLKPMICMDATTGAYEPYQGDTYAADFGQTVYGGTLDWLTGVLTVDTGIKVFDGTESIDTENGYYNFWAENIPQDAINAPGICSHYPYKKYYMPDEKQYGLNISYGIRFHVDMSVYPTADDFKSYLTAQYDAGTPVQVCYKLATPQTIQLTPQDLRMLDGTNTIYSDGTTNYVIFNSGASSLGKAYELFFKKTDTIPVSNGGTGATSASGARTNLEVPSKTGEGASGTWGISISGNAATATNISSATPTLSIGIESSAITVKTNNTGSLGSNNLAIRSALDFRWYDTNWQIGNLRGSSADSAGFGFAYSSDNGSTFSLKSYIDTNGNYIGNAATATLASYALKMQTYKQGSTTETYGTSYPLYAQWESSNVLKLKCDNYTVQTDTATQLTTSRTIQTNLGSTSSASFNGTANITPGVTGTLAVANGGTGTTTRESACNLFLNALSTGSSTPTDNDYYISQYVGGGNTTTTYHRRPVSELYKYIKGKTDSLYLPLSGGTVTGGLTVKNAAQYANMAFATNVSNNSVGLIFVDGGSSSGYNSPRLYFQVNSPTSAGGTTFTNYYELYYLPKVDNARTSNGFYYILTSKSPVTVAQGGTGSTSKSGARANLGITSGTSLPSNGSTGDIFFLYS